MIRSTHYPDIKQSLNHTIQPLLITTRTRIFENVFVTYHLVCVKYQTWLNRSGSPIVKYLKVKN